MSFQEIEIVEDWKPLDMPASAATFNSQNELTRSDLNDESENPNDDIDISFGSVFTLNVEVVEGIVLFKKINCSFFPNIIIIFEFL